MVDNKKLPIEEILEYEEFTDRVELLRELEEWIKKIGKVRASSMSIIAPRRLGKTVLLERLVNTVFFRPDYRVAPIYFHMGQEKMTLHFFILRYATTFFRQFIAYCLQSPELYRNQTITLEELLEYQSNINDVNIAQKMIEDFLRHYQESTYENAMNLWLDFICVPEMLAADSSTRVALLIDEFQEMKFCVYETSQEKFVELKAKGLLNDMAASDLTATYRRRSESRIAPMLVSGSAVTMIFRTVMGGPLGGRFGFKYVKPMSLPDGANLLCRLIQMHRPDLSITPENALYASVQVGGHPYYLYCLVASDYDQSFKNTSAIDDLIFYEITKGKIFGFWQTHFQNNCKFINQDNDQELGKKIIYYFSRYNNQPVDIKEIASKLGVSKKVVEEKIEKLYMADLVWRTDARYFAFNDICLMRYIQYVFEKDLTGIEPVDLKQQNIYNNLKGRFLELIVQVTMMKFNYETITGEYFGKSEDIKLPLFQVVDTKYVKASKSNAYQIDVFGSHENIVWLCECKYTRSRMGINQVKKLERARDAYQMECRELNTDIPDIQLWIISTGGFTEKVLSYAKQNNDIYFSDYDGIDGIFRFFGGAFHIPLFNNV